MACILAILKLVYGLNDIPYSIDLLKAKTVVFADILLENMAKNMDNCSLYLSQLPSLDYLFRSWEQKVKETLKTFQIPSIGNLDKFYTHLEKSNSISQDTEIIPPNSGLKKNLKNQDPGWKIKSEDSKSSLQFKTDLEDINSSFSKEKLQASSLENEYLKEELAHHMTNNAEYPIPACDYWVQKKKSSQKDYPCDYLFALHCIASLCGNMSTKQLNYICDKLDRFMSYQSISLTK